MSSLTRKEFLSVATTSETIVSVAVDAALPGSQGLPESAMWRTLPRASRYTTSMEFSVRLTAEKRGGDTTVPVVAVSDPPAHAPCMLGVSSRPDHSTWPLLITFGISQR